MGGERGMVAVVLRARVSWSCDWVSLPFIVCVTPSPRFLADLNSVVVEHDSSNTKRLNITIMDMPRFAPGDAAPVPVFLLRCIFDDHVRCMTACQVGHGATGARSALVSNSLCGFLTAPPSPLLVH